MSADAIKDLIMQNELVYNDSGELISMIEGIIMDMSSDKIDPVHNILFAEYLEKLTSFTEVVGKLKASSDALKMINMEKN